MGTTFEVLTDNNPLTYVLTSAKLDATGHRWVAALANFNFTIKYKSGKLNTDADALSRLFPASVHAICQAAIAQIPLVETVTGPNTSHLASEGVVAPDTLSKVDWRKEQRADPDVARLIHLRNGISRPREESLRKETPSVQKYLREWNKLHFQNDVLYRSATLDGQTVDQLVVPNSFRTRALKGVHDQVGHQGKDKTLWLARQRFYWPGLERDVVQKVESCPRCLRRKTPIKPVAQLNPIDSTYPMELVCMDFLSLKPCKGGYKHVLVITDHFTRYAQAIPCRNQTAQTTAKALYEHFIRFYSFPVRLHSDQGRNFESSVIKELCSIAQTEKSRTTPYHPMGNGSAERFNQTLIKMLGTLENDQKEDWSSYVAPLVQAYNATKSDATGFSPHFLMFGWHPRLSVDAYLGTKQDRDEVTAGPHSYGSKLKSRMQFAYDVAATHARKMGAKNKTRYDRGKQEALLEVGDRVLVRNVGIQGSQKLEDRWEEKPYVVVSIPDPDNPVYVVRLEKGSKSKTRTLHRNMLLPFNCIPVDDPPSTPKVAPSGTKQRKKLRNSRPAGNPTSQPDPETSSEEDSSGSGIYVIPARRRKPNNGAGQPISSPAVQDSQAQTPRTPSVGPTPNTSSLASTHLHPSIQDFSSMGSRNFPSPHSVLPTPHSALPTPHRSNRTEHQHSSYNSVGTPMGSRRDLSMSGYLNPSYSARSPSVLGPGTQPSPDTQPVSEPSGRPSRQRRPPDRYGEWVVPQIVWNRVPDDNEIFL